MFRSVRARETPPCLHTTSRCPPQGLEGVEGGEWGVMGGGGGGGANNKNCGTRVDWFGKCDDKPMYYVAALHFVRN